MMGLNLSEENYPRSTFFADHWRHLSMGVSSAPASHLQHVGRGMLRPSVAMWRGKHWRRERPDQGDKLYTKYRQGLKVWFHGDGGCYFSGCRENAEGVGSRQRKKGPSARAGCDENARPTSQCGQTPGVLHREGPHICHPRVCLRGNPSGISYS